MKLYIIGPLRYSGKYYFLKKTFLKNNHNKKLRKNLLKNNHIRKVFNPYHVTGLFLCTLKTEKS